MSRRLTMLAFLLLALLPTRDLGARGVAPDIQQFKPVTDVQGFVLLHDATFLPQLRPGFSLTLDYAVNPLEVQAPGFQRQFGITDGIFGIDLTAAFGVMDWWEVGLLFPVAQIPVETSFIDVVGGRQVGYGVGDIRLETRFRALDPKRFPVGLAGNVFLTLPSGSEMAGLGRGKPGGGLLVALSQRWTRFHFAVNVGYAFYPRATVANLTTGDELTWGLGAGVTPLKDHLDVRLELDGSFTPGPADQDGEERFGDPAHTPLELLASVEYRFDFGLAIRGGIGKGLSPGFGSPDIRFFAGASWAVFKPADRDKDGLPNREDACRKEPEDPDGWEDADGCPDPDNDGDGKPDVAEECPDQPEDADGWQDSDGCPDPDNDGDGTLDGVDTCPEEAEDADGWQDSDGCPDPDNDGDGIPDGTDACPMNAETVDGWADEDGCPDPDNDDDRIDDAADFCPDEAEQRNGVKDGDGCPDDRLVARRRDSIAILEPISFGAGGARIEAKSLIVLQAVAKLLADSPDILAVRVEGHTDNKGKPEDNQRLSQKRAEAVMKKLIELGVDAARLEAAGYGDARPASSNRTEEGRAANRRIEFRIVAQRAAPPPVRSSANPWGVPATDPSPLGPAPVAPPKPEPPPPAGIESDGNPW